MRTYITAIIALLISTTLQAQGWELSTTYVGNEVGISIDLNSTHPPDSVILRWNCDPISQHVMNKDVILLGDTMWFNFEGQLNVYGIGYYYPSLYPSYLSQNLILYGSNAPKLTLSDYSTAGQLNLQITTNNIRSTVIVLHPVYGQVHYQTTSASNFIVQKQFPSGWYIVFVRSQYTNQCVPWFLYKFYIYVP